MNKQSLSVILVLGSLVGIAQGAMQKGDMVRVASMLHLSPSTPGLQELMCAVPQAGWTKQQKKEAWADMEEAWADAVSEVGEDAVEAASADAVPQAGLTKQQKEKEWADMEEVWANAASEVGEDAAEEAQMWLHARSPLEHVQADQRQHERQQDKLASLIARHLESPADSQVEVFKENIQEFWYEEPSVWESKIKTRKDVYKYVEKLQRSMADQTAYFQEEAQRLEEEAQRIEEEQQRIRKERQQAAEMQELEDERFLEEEARRYEQLELESKQDFAE